MKKLTLNIIRIVISLGLLFYLIYIADIKKIIASLEQLNLIPVLLSLLAFCTAVLFLTFRWHLLNKSYGFGIGFFRLFIIYFIGFFFNNFLPTSIGGDLSRAYYLGQHSGNRTASIGTVFLERVIGLLATLSLAGISLIWLFSHFRTTRIIYVTLGLVALIAIFLAIVMSRRIYRRFSGLISMITFYDIGDKISKVFDTLHFYRNKKKILLSAYISSLGAQFMLIVMNFILATALQMHQVAFEYFFLVVPVTFVFSLLPSINGLGVRDTGYMLMLVRQGVEPAAVLSLSFLVTAIPLLMSLVGGAFFIFYRFRGVEAPILNEEKVG